MLEDLILAAVNEAQRKAEEMMKTEMEKVTGGMGMPGMF
jgi:DNA-binding protein YbaB